MKGLQVGRIVMYVPCEVDKFKEERAAIITRVGNKELGLINLTVFLDGRTDNTVVDGIYQNTLHVTSVPYKEDIVERSWHWPHREE